MRGAEGVVDVDLSQRSQLFGEGFLVFGFLFSEADVFQQDDVARLHGGCHRLGVFADNFLVRCQLDLFVQQLGEAGGYRSQRELLLILTLRASQVGAEDDLGLMVDQVLDGRQRSDDALVVGDDAILERDVKVAADQHPFAGDVDIFDGFFIQRIHHTKPAFPLLDLPAAVAAAIFCDQNCRNKLYNSSLL